MADSTDLVTFLRARLDEDEDNSPQWHSRDCYLVKRGEDMFGDVEPCDCPGPARVLRDVEAKRRVILLAQMLVDHPLTPAFLRMLASVYAEHPDYQAGWAV